MLRVLWDPGTPWTPLWLRACYYSTVVRFGFDSTAVRLLISKLVNVKVTATNSASRSRADIYFVRTQCSSPGNVKSKWNLKKI